jgi:N-methylhydantoinase B
MTTSSIIDPISPEMWWKRLTAIADEAGAMRSAFSTAVQESNDCAAVMMDWQGYSVAECSRGIPPICGSIPRAVCGGLANQTMA